MTRYPSVSTSGTPHHRGCAFDRPSCAISAKSHKNRTHEAASATCARRAGVRSTSRASRARSSYPVIRVAEPRPVLQGDRNLAHSHGCRDGCFGGSFRVEDEHRGLEQPHRHEIRSVPAQFAGRGGHIHARDSPCLGTHALTSTCAPRISRSTAASRAAAAR